MRNITSIIIKIFINSYNKLNLYISTVFMYINAYLKGIDISKGAKFYGLSILRRKLNTRISFGKNCEIRSTFTSNLIGLNRKCVFATHASSAKIKIGDNCGFSGTVIGAFESIVLGNNVRCGANTLITDSDWHPDDSRVKGSMPVVIDDNVWLGLNVIVLKGVHIGANSLIGAGSVVTKNIPSNVIAAGNPCKPIRNLHVS